MILQRLHPFKTKMKNHAFVVEDQERAPKTALFWWRTPEDFDEKGHFKIEVSDLSKLTPRLKVLREMERLAFIADEGLDDFKHRLLSYRAGDFWLPIGGIKKQDMDIPPVITILLVGLSSSGKSSFINLMYSVLGRSGIIPFAQTSGESSNYTTMYLEEHNVLRSPQSGFCVYDTRGLDVNQMDEGLVDVSTWICDGVQHNQPCVRPGDEKKIKGLYALSASMELSASRYVKRKVNCVMVVADLSEIVKAFQRGDLKQIEALRVLFHFPSIKKTSSENPILILTHGDTLDAEDRINGRIKICEYLGISETSCAYDIPCLTEQGILAEEFDPISAFALTEAIYRALLQSDRNHIPKRNLKDWILLILSLTMCYLASFFAMLAQLFSEFGQQKTNLERRF